MLLSGRSAWAAPPGTDRRHSRSLTRTPTPGRLRRSPTIRTSSAALQRNGCARACIMAHVDRPPDLANAHPGQRAARRRHVPRNARGIRPGRRPDHRHPGRRAGHLRSGDAPLHGQVVAARRGAGRRQERSAGAGPRVRLRRSRGRPTRPARCAVPGSQPLQADYLRRRAPACRAGPPRPGRQRVPDRRGPEAGRRHRRSAPLGDHRPAAPAPHRRLGPCQDRRPDVPPPHPGSGAGARGTRAGLLRDRHQLHLHPAARLRPWQPLRLRQPRLLRPRPHRRTGRGRAVRRSRHRQPAPAGRRAADAAGREHARRARPRRDYSYPGAPWSSRSCPA